MRAGVILAGGRSTRFEPGDKALADLGGRPMLRRVADRLAGSVDAVVVNCRRDQRPAFDRAMAGATYPYRFAIDPMPDRGPVAGIAAGLRAVEDAGEGGYAAVVGCDMPFVDPAVLGALFAAAEGHDGAVVRLEDGWLQTTQAVYRIEPMASACERLLASGGGRIVDAIEGLDVVELDTVWVHAHGDPATFENVNTVADLRAAARRLRSAETGALGAGEPGDDRDPET